MSQSKKADIHDLYEKSVQNVEHEIEFIQETYMNIKGKRAYIYREDFCGTALSSYKWIKQGENFEAIAIDNDCSVLDWSIKNRLNKLNVSELKRISMIESDVNQVNAKKVMFSRHLILVTLPSKQEKNWVCISRIHMIP